MAVPPILPLAILLLPANAVGGFVVAMGWSFLANPRVCGRNVSVDVGAQGIVRAYIGNCC
ncbi:MAG: hypothetical protein AMJ76_03795 [Dehalococcoidia bacterium SM23_28_1]|nr:MAG: hypothetical protein AMJ76_03795 [Dehalococcoidia bacterium SM23_28_1]